MADLMAAEQHRVIFRISLHGEVTLMSRILPSDGSVVLARRFSFAVDGTLGVIRYHTAFGRQKICRLLIHAREGISPPARSFIRVYDFLLMPVFTLGQPLTASA